MLCVGGFYDGDGVYSVDDGGGGNSVDHGNGSCDSSDSTGDVGNDCGVFDGGEDGDAERRKEHLLYDFLDAVLLFERVVWITHHNLNCELFLCKHF